MWKEIYTDMFDSWLDLVKSGVDQDEAAEQIYTEYWHHGAESSIVQTWFEKSIELYNKENK